MAVEDEGVQGGNDSPEYLSSAHPRGGTLDRHKAPLGNNGAAAVLIPYQWLDSADCGESLGGTGTGPGPGPGSGTGTGTCLTCSRRDGCDAGQRSVRSASWTKSSEMTCFACDRRLTTTTVDAFP